MNKPELSARIRRIVVEYGRLAIAAADLKDHDDLYAAGMTSHAGVNVLVALESELDLEFPDRLLTRGVFTSIASIRAAIEQLLLDSAPIGLQGRPCATLARLQPGTH